MLHILRLLLLGCLLAPAALAQDGSLRKMENGRLLVPPPVDERIEVVDGDTIWVGIFQIRLHGIDALEPKQGCSVTGFPKTWCHTSASEYLRTFTQRDDFRCEMHVKDGENRPWINYGRYIATCYAGAVEVNRAMVEAGWAYAADGAAGASYRAIEARAKAAKLGIHKTKHELPKKWRKQQRSPDCDCQ